MSDEKETFTEYKCIGFEAGNGVYVIGITGDSFLFGITWSTDFKGLHIGPFQIGRIPID